MQRTGWMQTNGFGWQVGIIIGWKHCQTTEHKFCKQHDNSCEIIFMWSHVYVLASTYHCHVLWHGFFNQQPQRSLLSPQYSTQNPTWVLEFCRTHPGIWHSARLWMEYNQNGILFIMSYESVLSPAGFHKFHGPSSKIPWEKVKFWVWSSCEITTCEIIHMWSHMSIRTWCHCHDV